MATNSPISGKSMQALASEAVDAGASLDDIQGVARTNTDAIVGDVQVGVQSEKHIPLGAEFDTPTEAVEATPEEPVPEEAVETTVDEGRSTESGKHRELLESMAPLRQDGLEKPTLASPDWFTSLKWGMQDYGITPNIARWTQQALDQPDPEGAAKISANIDELMYGVSEEYLEYIEGQPNFEAAERESDRIRTLEYRNALRNNEGIGQAIATGFLGFVLDPVNLVPGGIIVKGMGMSARLATAAGLRGAAETTLAKRVGVWSAAGGVEELARNAPRLASDATYKADQYMTEAALGMAFGGAIPVIGAGARGAFRTLGKTVDEVNNFAHAMGLDTAYRATVNTAYKVGDQVAGADGGIIAKVKAVDPGEAVRKAKVQAKEQISNKVREGRMLDIREVVAEAVETGVVTNVKKAMAASALRVGRMIDVRSEKDFGEVLDKLKLAGKEAPGTEQGAKDAGSAQRKTTTGDKVQDAAHDVKMAAKEAKAEAAEHAKTLKKMLDEANLPEDARRNIEFLIDRIRNQTEDAVDAALARKGIKPQRSRLNNKDHTAVVGDAMGNVRKSLSKLYNRIGQGIDDLPNIKIAAKASAAMNRAYKAAGITKEPGESWAQALERHTKGMSHTQRKVTVQRITDEWNNGTERLKQELDADPRLTPEQVNALARQMDEAQAAVNQQFDLANMLARNPYEDAVVTKAQWSQISEGWRTSVDMEEIARQFADSKTQSAVKHQFGKLTESLSSRMLKSGAPLAQWFTMNVLETPAGFGGKLDRAPLTAAIYAENLDNQAKFPVLQAWETMMKEAAAAEKWPWLKRVFNKQGNAKTHSDVTRLSKEVQLEMNARHFGTQSNASPHVKKFADQLEKSYADLHDLQNGHVLGIHNGNKIQGYQHQVWDDQKILDLIATDVGRKGLVDIFRQGYLNAGMDMGKASILAKAMVDQKATAAARPRGQEFEFGSEQIRGMMPELEDVVARLRKDGTDEDIIMSIIEHINKSAKGDMPGYAKSRLPIDLNAEAVVNGQRVKVVDLMDNDVPQIFMRYSKEATARRAISEATDGVLNSDKAMNDMMLNMALEAQELGANVDTRAVRNALGMLMGRQYDGQLPMDVRRARDAVSLAGMGGLGESQLAEFGLAINRGMSGLVGAMQKARSVAGRTRKWRGLELTPEQASDKKFLSELQEASGLFQDLYQVDRRNVHFDAQEKNFNGLSKIVDTVTGGKFRPLMQHMQAKYTGYGVIRQFEDQIAMASLVQDMAKQFGGRKAFTSAERWKDLGVDVAESGWLAKRFKETVTYKADGTVEQLNLNQWSDLDRNKLGVILNRYSSQQVQKGFVGEASPEMMNPWVSFLMQFKSYPMLAAEKQQARHLKFADKEAAMGMVLNAASSGAARAIRYHSMAAAMPEQDREAYLDRKFERDFAHDTLMYMGGVGMMVNNMDMAFGAATGRDRYGYEWSVAGQLPVLNYMDQYMKAVKGPLDAEVSDRDMRNIQMAAPLGTIAHSNILFGIIRNMMDDE